MPRPESTKTKHKRAENAQARILRKHKRTENAQVSPRCCFPPYLIYAFKSILMHDYMCGMHSSCGEPCDMQHSGRGAYGAPRPWAGGRAQQHAELQSHGPWALIWRRTNRHETAYGADTCVNILWQHTELTSLQFGWPRIATCGVAITRPSVPHTERTNRHETAYRADACANILMKARLHV